MDSPLNLPWFSHSIFHGSIFHELQNVSVVVVGTPLGVRKQSRHRHICEFLVILYLMWGLGPFSTGIPTESLLASLGHEP